MMDEECDDMKKDQTQIFYFVFPCIRHIPVLHPANEKSILFIVNCSTTNVPYHYHGKFKHHVIPVAHMCML
jgi:hypothetical protein